MPQAAHVSRAPDPQGHALIEQESRQGVEQAFALFNQVSSQLSQSYSLLEARVSELKGELAVVSAQRIAELSGLDLNRLDQRLQLSLGLGLLEPTEAAQLNAR